MKFTICFSVLVAVVNAQSNNNTEAAVPQKRCIVNWLFPLFCELNISNGFQDHRAFKTNVDDAPATDLPDITQTIPSDIPANYGNEPTSVSDCGSYGCPGNEVTRAINIDAKPTQAEWATVGTNKCGNKVPASQYGCPRGYSSDMNGCCDSSQ